MRWTEEGSDVRPKGSVFVVVEEVGDVEANQSAEIIYRELMAHNISAVLDSRKKIMENKIKEAAFLGGELVVLLSSNLLLDGCVEISRLCPSVQGDLTSESWFDREEVNSVKVHLEDAVDVVLQMMV